MFQIASTPKGEKSIFPDENEKVTDIVFPSVKNRTCIYVSSLAIAEGKVTALVAMVGDGDAIPPAHGLVSVVLKIRHEGTIFTPATPASENDMALFSQLSSLLGDSYVKISRSGRFMTAKPLKSGNTDKRTPAGNSSQKKVDPSW